MNVQNHEMKANSLKIKVLIDNLPDPQGDSFTEHGLAVYFEHHNLKLLADTGQSALFAKNALKMGISLEQTDMLFISHGHYDHLGGLLHFLEINSKAEVIISPNAFQDFYSLRHQKHIGAGFDIPERHQHRLRFIGTDTEVAPGIHALRCTDAWHPRPKANRTLMKRHEDNLQPDDFAHELLLCIENDDHLVLYTGCAHSGVQNMMQTASFKFRQKRIALALGGFHLIDSDTTTQYETEDELVAIAECLKNDYPATSYITGHCTGTNSYNMLKKVLGPRLSLFHTGYESETRKNQP